MQRSRLLFSRPTDRVLRRMLVCAVLLIAVGATILLPKSEHSRKTSPDSRQVAIAYSRVIWSLIPTLPGSGSDKPGWIRIETQDGRQIKEYSVDMVWRIDDIRWEDGEAQLPFHN